MFNFVFLQNGGENLKDLNYIDAYSEEITKLRDEI